MLSQSRLAGPILGLLLACVVTAALLGGGVARDAFGGGDDLFAVGDAPTVQGRVALRMPGDPLEAADDDGELDFADDDGDETVGAHDVAFEEQLGPRRPTIVRHRVAAGETLTDIARLYDIDIDTIVAANDLVDPNGLRAGQELRILTARGALHVVQRGENLWDIARAYQVDMQAIVEVNGITDPARIAVRQELIIPGAQALGAARRREQLVSGGQLLRNFDWPTRGRISSRYDPRWGRMHQGIDIAVPTGTPVRAAAAGTVTFSGWGGGYGYLVTIDHGNGVETRYAHHARNVVTKGEHVRRGQIIAYSGNTGNSTGPHLHFEIRHRGRSVDPLRYLK